MSDVEALIARAKKSAVAVYLATDATVADDLSGIIMELVGLVSAPTKATFTAEEVIGIANDTSDLQGNLYRLDFISRIEHEAGRVLPVTPTPELSPAELAEVERFGIHDEMTQNWKAFIVNIEGPDDIEDFDTMREAVDHANELNLLFTEIIAGGGEFAPHMWAVPWRTAVYLSQFPRENHV